MSGTSPILPDVRNLQQQGFVGWGLLVSGNQGVGQILSVSMGPNLITGGQWYRDGVAISGATALTYQQQQADLQHVLTFQLPIGSGLTLVSNPFAVGNFALSALTLAGSGALGAQVGVSYLSQFTAAGGALPYTFDLATGSLAGTGLVLSSAGAVASIAGVPNGTGNIGPLTVRVTDAVGTAITASPFTIVVSAAPGVAPGALASLTAGAATTSTQVLNWTAPNTGDTPFTYDVGRRLTSAGGAYTQIATGLSALTVTATGLAASTAYDYQVRAVNAVGPGPYTPLPNVTTASSAANTKPKTALAPSGTSGPTLLAAATDIPGSSNGGKAGTFSITTTSGNYGFCLVANAGSVTFTDVGTGFTGGWTLQGNFVDSGSGATYYIYQQDFPHAYPSGGTVTIS